MQFLRLLSLVLATLLGACTSEAIALRDGRYKIINASATAGMAVEQAEEFCKKEKGFDDVNFIHKGEYVTEFSCIKAASQNTTAAGSAMTEGDKARAESVPTTVCIKNNLAPQVIKSRQSVMQRLTGVKSPGQGFDGARINTGETLCQRIAIDENETVPNFVLGLYDKSIFGLYEKEWTFYYYNDYVGRHGWATEADWDSPLAPRGEIDYPFTNGQLKRGYLCPGTECYLFKIGDDPQAIACTMKAAEKKLPGC